jgi:hypothetical protein
MKPQSKFLSLIVLDPSVEEHEAGQEEAETEGDANIHPHTPHGDENNHSSDWDPTILFCVKLARVIECKKYSVPSFLVTISSALLLGSEASSASVLYAGGGRDATIAGSITGNSIALPFMSC